MQLFRFLRLRSDYRAVFDSSEAGRRVLADLVRQAGLNQYSIGNDPLILSHWEGRRYVVLRILEMLHQPVEKHIEQNYVQGDDHGEG